MKISNRVERILKDLDVLAREMDTVAKSGAILETKVERLRIVKMLRKCRSDVRLKLFDIEDCEKIFESLKD